MDITWAGIGETLFYAAITGLVTWFVARSRYRYKVRGLIPVALDARPVEAKNPWIAPKILIATFTGYQEPKEMESEEFEAALRAADLDKLPLHEAIPGIGHTVRSLLTHRKSLEKVYLITTLQSEAAAGLLQRFATSERLGVEVLARPQEVLGLDDDREVLRRSHEVTLDLLLELREKGINPKDVLVDVTGGTRSMSLGALLACLMPDQRVQVIATRYISKGEPDYQTSYPLVVDFKPDLEALRLVSRS